MAGGDHKLDKHEGHGHAHEEDSHDHPHPHPHDHGPEHGHGGSHGHTHGTIDPSITGNERGLWAVKWSFVGLMITTILQIGVFFFSNSIALLADAIHNLGDAMTAAPIGIAFILAKRKPNKTFTYGYGRVEDLAGMCVVGLIFVSAAVALYESVQRFFRPEPVTYLWAVAVAAVIGFAGNEAVALFRIRVGKEINSTTLSADGYHARTDGLTSLAVLLGAIGVWLGFPLADPIIGLIITLAIGRIVWQSSKAVFTRALDGVEPEVIETIRKTAAGVEGVHNVEEIRARWLGHRLTTEMNVTVASELSVAEGHQVGNDVRHALQHELPYLESAVIHVDPAEASGESFHHIHDHTHDGLPAHSH